MLLKKKIMIAGILFILLFPIASYAQVCEVGKIKQALRKALYLHFIQEGGSGLTPNEVKDMLIFYLTISSQNSTVDCSALGLNSNKPLFDVIGIGENLLDRIPACAEGTKYGECSKIRPSYCYAGAVYERCGLCGCPTSSVCGKSGKCEALSLNVTCFRDIDCGQSAFVGDYFCSNNYIVKSYVNYTCISPGTVNSKCLQSNGTTILNYCNPTLNQMCAAGQSTCQLTINDSAPAVAISVSPASTTKGQFFNVTVTGTDDVGLAAVWWWGVSTSDTELNKAHWYNCNGAKVCKYSWLVSTNATGVLTLGANSRDTAYPIAGQPHQASEGAGIAYAAVTVTEPGATAVSGLTIKGRLVDKNTLKPVPNIAIFLGTSTTGQALNPIYTNANGEFAVTTATNITSAKMFPYWPKCYQQGFFLLEKKFDGSLNVRLYLFDLVREDKSFAVTGPEVNLGDVPLWPSVDIAVNSDIAVQMNIEYPEEGRGYGNINYKTSHYLSNIMPLAYNARVQLKDQSGNAYYSPYQTYGLENGCAPVTLTFSGKQFIWSGAQTDVSNASTCFVKIDGVVVKSVYATDRNDCYSKTSFGSENCKTYAPYFTDGVHFLEQYFGENDRVNNEYCTCTNGVCVQGNQTAQSITFHSLAVNGSNLEAVYSKNFDTCVHLLSSTSTITHTQNYFCTQGNYIKTTASLSGFNVAVGQNYKLCHGNNYNVCSGLTALTNVTAVDTTCTDSDNGYDYYKYGEVKDISGKIWKDACIPDLSGLTEFACQTSGNYTSRFYSCVNENKVCSSGACVPASGNSWCSDPDGVNINQYSVVSYSVEGVGYTSADYCVNDDGLVESKCDNKQQRTEYYSCKSLGKICQNGACINSTATANQTQPDSCLDSDNGIYPYTKGFAAGYQKGALVNLSDYCAGSTNYIYEAYCGANITYQIVACSYQCSNGACVNQSTTKPDLIVSSITFSPANPTTADYTNVFFIIKNIGTAPASNFSLKVEYVGGQSFLFGTGYLPPDGTTQPGYLGNYWPAGTNTFIATVDIDNKVAEIDENNNVLTKSVTVVSATNQTTLKGYAEICADGTECKSNLTCISDPLDNNAGKCGWWGSAGTFSQCSAGYYPSTPCQCGKMAIYAGACNHGIFYWPPTQAGGAVGSSCTDSSQCSTGICIFGKCSYAVRCHPQTPGYCHDHEECVAFGASC